MTDTTAGYVRPEDRVFDRLPEFDPKSRRFSIEEVLEVPYARSYTWGCSTNLDQGADGACVGFAWSQEAAAKPVPIGTDYATAMALYHAAQEIDEWPGHDYEGTSVLAGAKVAQSYGWNVEYRWAFDTPSRLSGVARKGPAVLGLNWKDGMFYPDANGRILATGQTAGGHAILERSVRIVWQPGTTAAQKRAPGWLRLVDRKQSMELLHNSWGPQRGGTDKGPGTAWISVEDMDMLMAEQGECCFPIRKR